MTDTVRKAADILYQRSGMEGHSAQTACQEHAQALHDAGLLAPDLPEPDHDTRDPKWRAEYKENYGYEAPDVWCMNPWLSVGVFPGENEIRVWDDGEPLEPFSIAEARKLAYCFLAAANHAEGNNE